MHLQYRRAFMKIKSNKLLLYVVSVEKNKLYLIDNINWGKCSTYSLFLADNISVEKELNYSIYMAVNILNSFEKSLEVYCVLVIWYKVSILFKVV